MSFLAGGIANVTGQAAGLGKSAGIFQELTGQPGRVQFLRSGGGVILQCDAVLNESHTRESAPTQFPVENGSSLSDHIILGPPEVSITGIVTDTPLYDPNKFLTQSIGNVFSGILPPLGVVGLSTGYALAHPKDNFFKRSTEAFRTLRTLQAGDPNTSPPTPPEPFTIITAYARYSSMVVKSLQFPRDANSNGQCVFTLVATQLRVVSPQLVITTKVKNPALGASIKSAGEKQATKPNGFLDGKNATDATFKSAGEVVDSAKETVSSAYSSVKDTITSPFVTAYKFYTGG